MYIYSIYTYVVFNFQQPVYMHSRTLSVGRFPCFDVRARCKVF